MYPFDGIIDIHAHADPDKTGRSLDVLELAKLYQDRGFRALVLMNHYDSMAGMAYLVNKYTPGLDVYGGEGNNAVDSRFGGLEVLASGGNGGGIANTYLDFSFATNEDRRARSKHRG